MSRYMILTLLFAALTSHIQAEPFKGSVQKTSDNNLVLVDDKDNLWMLDGVYENNTFTSGETVMIDGTKQGNTIHVNSFIRNPRVSNTIDDAAVITVPDLTVIDIPYSDPFITKIKSHTIIFEYCDFNASFTSTQIRQQWFENSTSLQHHIQTCSHNVSTFTEEDNVICDVVLKIPCKGTYENIDYDLSTRCTSAELYAINYWVRLSLNGQYKDSVIIAMLPVGNKCRWTGLANVGCSTYSCIIWNNAKTQDSLKMITFHELGHIFKLNHANLPGENGVYRDFSCAMGFCCAERCYNAPNSYVIGWSQMLLDLKNEWTDDMTIIDIPSTLVTPKNFIRLDTYYISYKVAKGVESGLYDRFANTVLVHHKLDDVYESTTLLTQLSVNETFTFDDFMITIKVLSLNCNDTATIQIQRLSSTNI